MRAERVFNVDGVRLYVHVYDSFIFLSSLLFFGLLFFSIRKHEPRILRSEIIVVGHGPIFRGMWDDLGSPRGSGEGGEMGRGRS